MHHFPVLDEEIELEQKTIKQNDEPVSTKTKSKTSDTQRSIKQRTEIEKWSKTV